MAMKRVLCFGDSLTAGYHSGGHGFEPYGRFLNKALGSGYEIVSVGFSGWTTRQMLDHLDSSSAQDLVGQAHPGLRHLLQQSNYDLLILMGGTNDLGRGLGAQDVANNLKELARASQQVHPSLKVALLGIPDSAFLLYNDEARSRRDKINVELASSARDPTQSGIHYIPNPVTFFDGSPNFEPDGLHFSPQGYASLGETLAGLVKPILEGDDVARWKPSL